MKKGVLVSTGAGFCAAIGLMMVFINSASPYVSVAEAPKHSAKVHVVGDIIKETLKPSVLQGEVNFTIKDETGEMPVKYVGPPQSNLDEATQVVVIGSMENDVFLAKQMLVKCPSKYESEKREKAQA